MIGEKDEEDRLKKKRKERGRRAKKERNNEKRRERMRTKRLAENKKETVKIQKLIKKLCDSKNHKKKLNMK